MRAPAIEQAGEAGSSRRWFALAVLCVSLLIVTLDNTGLLTAAAVAIAGAVIALAAIPGKAPVRRRLTRQRNGLAVARKSSIHQGR